METAAETNPAPKNRKRVAWRNPRWAVALYCVGLVAVWLAVYFGADRWWAPTLIMFGPKWVYAVPLPFFLAWSAATRPGRLTWLLLAAAAGVVAFPIAGFCVPWRMVAGSPPSDLCILTCNTSGTNCDPARLAALVAEVQPDIVCLQECSPDVAAIFNADWNVVQAGELLVASKDKLEKLDVLTRDLPSRWPRSIGLLVRATHAGHTINVATMHLFSPRYGLAEMTDWRTLIAPWRRDTLLEQTEYRRRENEQASRWLAGRDSPLVIAGDFNTPTSSRIYRASWGGYQNAFTQAGFGLGHTVSLQQGGLRFTSRVDHILSTADFQFSTCHVGPDVGSDHLPVVAKVRTP